MATPEQREAWRAQEVEAIVAGVRAQLVSLDERVDLWRSSMMSAFTLLAQRDASDEKDRKTRQAKLDYELRLLRWGVLVSLFLLVVLVSLFVGYRLK